MIHLEWHQHAFLDKNNKVILVAVFDDWAHNHQLLEDVRTSNNAEKIICCCVLGLANAGDTWDGTQFIPPSPFPSFVWDNTVKQWVNLVPKPDDSDGAFYEWDESLLKWVEQTPYQGQ